MVYAKQKRQANRLLKNQTKKVRLRCHREAKKCLSKIDGYNYPEQIKNNLIEFYTSCLKK